MGRRGGENQINVFRPDDFLSFPHGVTFPADTGIGDEEVEPNPFGEAGDEVRAFLGENIGTDSVVLLFTGNQFENGERFKSFCTPLGATGFLFPTKGL